MVESRTFRESDFFKVFFENPELSKHKQMLLHQKCFWKTIDVLMSNFEFCVGPQRSAPPRFFPQKHNFTMVGPWKLFKSNFFQVRGPQYPSTYRRPPWHPTRVLQTERPQAQWGGNEQRNHQKLLMNDVIPHSFFMPVDLGNYLLCLPLFRNFTAFLFRSFVTIYYLGIASERTRRRQVLS